MKERQLSSTLPNIANPIKNFVIIISNKRNRPRGRRKKVPPRQSWKTTVKFFASGASQLICRRETWRTHRRLHKICIYTRNYNRNCQLSKVNASADDERTSLTEFSFFFFFSSVSILIPRDLQYKGMDRSKISATDFSAGRRGEGDRRFRASSRRGNDKLPMNERCDCY